VLLERTDSSSVTDTLPLAYDALFLNFGIWTRCVRAQQSSLIGLIIQHAKKNPKVISEVYFRTKALLTNIWQRVSRLFSWQRILNVLLKYYALPSANSQILESSKMTPEDIRELRSQLIQIMRLTVIKGVPNQQMEALLRFLSDQNDPAQYQDVLDFLASLFEQALRPQHQQYRNLHKVFFFHRTFNMELISSDFTTKAFDECGGCLLINTLLGREEMETKRKALLLLASLMEWTTCPAGGSFGKQLRKKLETYFFTNQCSVISKHFSSQPLTGTFVSLKNLSF